MDIAETERRRLDPGIIGCGTPLGKSEHLSIFCTSGYALCRACRAKREHQRAAEVDPA